MDMTTGYTTTAVEGNVRGVSGTVRDALTIAKLRIGVSIALAAMAGMFTSPGPLPAAGTIAVLLGAVLLAASCAGAFNHYVEADLDARMARTRERPFVTGAIPRRGYWPWVFAILALTAVTAAGWATNAVAAGWVLLGAFFYAVVYTLWLKRRTRWNIVIGGAAGSFAVLAGAAAVDPGLHAVPILLAVALFLWTPSHFWSLAIALKEDYAAAGVPMLPVLVGEKRAARVVVANTVALVGVSIAPAFFGLGAIYLLGTVFSGGYLLWRTVEMARRPQRRVAMKAFFASLIQLAVVLAAAIADTLLSGAV